MTIINDYIKRILWRIILCEFDRRLYFTALTTHDWLVLRHVQLDWLVLRHVRLDWLVLRHVQLDWLVLRHVRLDWLVLRHVRLDWLVLRHVRLDWPCRFGLIYTIQISHFNGLFSMDISGHHAVCSPTYCRRTTGQSKINAFMAFTSFYFLKINFFTLYLLICYFYFGIFRLL